MLTSSTKWVKSLPRIAKVALVIVGLGAATAFAAPPAERQTQPAAEEKPTPVITTETITETETIPFAKTTRESSNLPKGTSKVTTVGVNGEKTLTYNLTLTDGKETSRNLIDEKVTMKPIDEVASVGTYIALPKPKPTPAPASTSNCDPNYSGCVPIASDVDCAGGSGNGPAYTGFVRVIGSDIYGLDRDGDGLACE